MMWQTVRAVVVLTAALIAPGCKSSLPHIQCTTDSQCTLPGRPGVCSGGTCAIHDTMCPSGLRYDKSAGGSGECVPVVVTSACSRDSDCANGGQPCGGVCTANKCVYPGPTTTCGTECTGTTQTAKACDGEGSCVAASTKECGAYKCDAAGQACRTMCTTADDCNGVPCIAGACGNCPDDMVYVAPAKFTFSSAVMSAPPEDTYPPEVTVTMTKAYCIGKTEVTVGEYRACVQSGTCSTPTPVTSQDKNYLTWTDAPGDWEKMPVNSVTWDQASAYCTWAGRRLPTDVEWERAARGIDGRTYPWGQAFMNDETCPYSISYFFANGGAEAPCWTSAPFFAPVGSAPKGVSPVGMLDASGEVTEWVQDCKTDSGVGECASDCTDPSPPTACSANKAHIARGGSVLTFDQSVLARFAVDPHAGTAIASYGIRCAK